MKVSIGKKDVRRNMYGNVTQFIICESKWSIFLYVFSSEQSQTQSIVETYHIEGPGVVCCNNDDRRKPKSAKQKFKRSK